MNYVRVLYVSEIDTCPIVKFNMVELEEDVFDFSVEFSAEDDIDYDSLEK